MNCPECGKKHRKFPHSCYYEPFNDNAFAIIADVASHGNPVQKEWGENAKKRFAAMEQYVKQMGFVEPLTKG